MILVYWNRSNKPDDSTVRMFESISGAEAFITQLLRSGISLDDIKVFQSTQLTMTVNKVTIMDCESDKEEIDE